MDQPFQRHEANNDYSTAVAIDGSNNVIVIGQSVDSSGGNDYDDQVFERGRATVDNYHQGAVTANVAIAVDASDNVLVTGNSVSDEFFNNNVTIKYSSAGVPLCETNRYHGPGVGGEESRAIAVDGSGSMFVTGNSPSIS